MRDLGFLNPPESWYIRYARKMLRAVVILSTFMAFYIVIVGYLSHASVY